MFLYVSVYMQIQEHFSEHNWSSRWVILIILAHLAHLPQSYFSLIIIGFNTHNCSLFYLTNSQYCSDWRKKHGENWPMLMTFSLTAIAPITGLGKSRRIPSAFWDLRRKSIFPFSHAGFEKVDAFLGPNGTTHEIYSYERANFSLSDGAKQNFVGSIVFELWFFESFFIFSYFCIFPKNKILS